MFNEFHLPILKVLFYMGCINEKVIDLCLVIGKFPEHVQHKARIAMTELIAWGYVDCKTTTKGDLISLSMDRLEDVRRWINPNPNVVVEDNKPLEDYLPKEYERNPILVTKGDHEVKGVSIAYRFHRKKSDPTSRKVFLDANGKRRPSITLGSIHDPNSLYRKGVEGIQNLCAYTVFTKAKLNELGDEIVGNRQPIKVLIDIMIFDGYLIQVADDHYQRTIKQIPPLQSIDNFNQEQKDEKDKVGETA